jgi:acyl-coenzyme A synthetase/AMP-(fatty) acid ligase
MTTPTELKPHVQHGQTILLCCRAPAAFALAHTQALRLGLSAVLLAPADWPRLAPLALAVKADWIVTDEPDRLAALTAIPCLSPQSLCALGSPSHAAGRVTLLTGGSTGPAQPVVKSPAMMDAETAMLLQLFDHRVPPLRAIVSTVPFEHMFGHAFGFRLGQAAGLALQSQRVVLPADLQAALDQAPAPAWVVTTPTHLRAYARRGLPLRGIAGMICATSPLPQDLLAAMAPLTGGAPILEIYGSTETGALASRVRQAKEIAAPLWQPLSGVILLDHDEKGCRWTVPGHADPVLLADLVAVADAGFQLLGRADDLVKVAGKRQSLATLSGVLGGLFGVRDAAFLAPAPQDVFGRLRAVVVLEPGQSRDDVLDRLAKQIDPVFLPRPVLAIAAVPRSDTGKVRLAELEALFATEEPESDLTLFEKTPA